jgi:hypothetical protein
VACTRNSVAVPATIVVDTDVTSGDVNFTAVHVAPALTDFARAYEQICDDPGVADQVACTLTAAVADVVDSLPAVGASVTDGALGVGATPVGVTGVE